MTHRVAAKAYPALLKEGDRQTRAGPRRIRAEVRHVLVGLLWAGAACAQPGLWDPNRYIDVNEVRPGMEAYCLTCYSGSAVERFAMEVVSVMRGFEPGSDAILVMGKDERFKHTGVVAGCSGSPVYIHGRLAGALAFGWTYSKDPLYGVRPIKSMLSVGQRSVSPERTSLSVDFSRPIDLTGVALTARPLRATDTLASGGLRAGPCVMMVSGLSSQGLDQVAQVLGPWGFETASAVAGGDSSGPRPELTPGASLMLPLVDGDITMAVVGTVTEVRGDRIYGFGHPFVGQGPLDLPLATGEIHTVVSNLARSFKLASPLEVVGALTDDEPTAVVGRLGSKARTLPVTIRVYPFTTATPLRFVCRVAYHKALTAELLKATIAGAAFAKGMVPPEHSVRYKASIRVEGGRELKLDNLSSGTALTDVLGEVSGITQLLMNNPFEPVGMEALDLEVHLTDQPSQAYISGIELSDRRVKRGQTFTVKVVLDSVLGRRQVVEMPVQVPLDQAPGQYTLTVCGPQDYQDMVRRVAGHRLTAYDTRSLLDALDYLLSLRRDRLYAILEVPAAGLAVGRGELPDLPATKAVTLQSPTRSVRIQPLQKWVEQSLTVGTVTTNKDSVRIVVER